MLIARKNDPSLGANVRKPIRIFGVRRKLIGVNPNRRAKRAQRLRNIVLAQIPVQKKD